MSRRLKFIAPPFIPAPPSPPKPSPPPSPAPPPALNPDSNATSGSSGLQGWQIVLIVVLIIGVAVIAALALTVWIFIGFKRSLVSEDSEEEPKKPSTKKADDDHQSEGGGMDLEATPVRQAVPLSIAPTAGSLSAPTAASVSAAAADDGDDGDDFGGRMLPAPPLDQAQGQQGIPNTGQNTWEFEWVLLMGASHQYNRCQVQRLY